LVNFYADWCRFSRQLHPIFVTTDTAMREAYPDESVVRMGRVDCDAEEKLAQKYRISKYPTIKVFRNGIEMKKEYRGNRSPSDFQKYVQDLLKDPVEEFQNLDEAKRIIDDRKKGILVGYFGSADSTEYKTFSKVAKALSEECSFIAGFGAASEKERVTGDNIMFYDVEHGSAPVSEAVFLGALTNYDLVFKWAHDKCIPLVREITFENGEELTEEGKPFLILFHTREDTQSLKYFQNEISRSLVGEEENVNFLHANCAQFSHPLQHMGKTVDDCPVIAIDSFKHMYLFPDFSLVHQEGRLLQFVKDLHSGKLHREFHQGPDEKTEALESTTEELLDSTVSMEKDSVFKKLKPSKHRYSIRPRDEL